MRHRDDVIVTGTKTVAPPITAVHPKSKPRDIPVRKKTDLLIGQQGNTTPPTIKEYADHWPIDWNIRRYILVMQLYIIEDIPLKQGTEPMRRWYQFHVP